jgi:hypothetical protein
MGGDRRAVYQYVDAAEALQSLTSLARDRRRVGDVRR